MQTAPLMEAVTLRSNGNPIRLDRRTLVHTVTNEHEHFVDLLLKQPGGGEVRFTIPYHSTLDLHGFPVPAGTMVYVYTVDHKFSRFWRVGRCCTFMPFFLFGMVPINSE